MKCFSCCMSDETLTKWSLQKSIEEHHDTKVLASYANISFDPDDDRKRLIGKETTKGCKGNATAKVFKYDELCDATNNFNPRNQIDLSPEMEPLDWNTRIKIAVGAAKGLEYLHERANPQVIYRDFKTSNILLDQDFNPKLSDFGLAKVGPTGDNSHVFSRVIGTYGYCAPEYVLTGQLSTKSDVYSFGVVFLEMITGRIVVDNSKPPDERNLVTWAKPLMDHRRKFVLLADPLLDGECPVKGLHQALTVAAMCLQEEPSLRPLMSYVVAALERLVTSDEPEEGKPMGNEHQEHHTSSNGGRLSI
ncbi:hypothetical protein V6N11_079308 [Hibiscus sabdariffa]|uniref:Protein kinase domain-containing protein n=1 Tax=Hibiscus sabdariffa TaxID=183260 RepID=A0ABR2RV12_9ROSI